MDVSALLADLHHGALATGLFDIDGIRSRAVRRDQYKVGDGDPDNGFLSVTVRIGQGRSVEDRQALGRSLLAAVETALADVLPSTPVSVAVEVQEIDRAMTFRRNTIRERRRSGPAA